MVEDARGGPGPGRENGTVGVPNSGGFGGGAGELSVIVGGIQGCGSEQAVSGLGPPAGGGGGGQGFEQDGLDGGVGAGADDDLALGVGWVEAVELQGQALIAAELDAGELLDGPGGQAGGVELAD